MASAHPSAGFADLLAFARRRNFLPPAGPRARYTFKARGAIAQYLRAVATGERREVLVPAYHCPTVVHAIEQAGCKPRFYGVNQDLTVDLPGLRSALGAKTVAVIVINFFGFPAPIGDLPQAVRACGAKLIEDCSHSFLNANPLRTAGERGDAAVYALWKLAPGLVGGLVLSNQPDAVALPPQSRLPPHQVLRLVKLLVEEAFDGLPDGPMRRAFLALERFRVERRRQQARMGNAGYVPPTVDPLARYAVVRDDFECGLPWLPRHILQHADLGAIAAQRRANYELLASLVSGLEDARPVFPTLPADVVPWCLPLRMKDRRRFDYRMRARGVPLFTFGEALHPSLFAAVALPPAALDNACRLRDDVVCLPVHQKLSVEDLEEMAAGVREVVGEVRAHQVSEA